MYSWFLIALTIIFAVIVAKLILKKYNAIFVFFASGVVILMAASLLTGTPILPKGSLGNVFLDTFGFLTVTFKKNIAGIGTLIMVVTGCDLHEAHWRFDEAGLHRESALGRDLEQISDPLCFLSHRHVPEARTAESCVAGRSDACDGISCLHCPGDSPHHGGLRAGASLP